MQVLGRLVARLAEPPPELPDTLPESPPKTWAGPQRNTPIGDGPGRDRHGAQVVVPEIGRSILFLRDQARDAREANAARKRRMAAIHGQPSLF